MNLSRRKLLWLPVALGSSKVCAPWAWMFHRSLYSRRFGPLEFAKHD